MTIEDLRLRHDEAAADLTEAATRLAQRCGVAPPDLPPVPAQPEAVILVERLGDFLGDLDARLSVKRPTGRKAA